MKPPGAAGYWIVTTRRAWRKGEPLCVIALRSTFIPEVNACEVQSL
jgi:hypothetical protein